MRWSSKRAAADFGAGVALALAVGAPARAQAPPQPQQPAPAPTTAQSPQTPAPALRHPAATAHRGAAAPAVDARWQPSLDAFAAADRAHPPATGGVVFVGSSSIRLWEGLEDAFGDTAVIRRGFGGSRLSDCARHVDELVLPYRPRLVVLYAGDNDLWEGVSPEDVLASFKAFARHVRADLPDTRIAYVSIKPSPHRVRVLPQVRAANALIERYASREPGVEYVDVYSKMVDANGVPRRDLFRTDLLHLNRAGYAIWKAAIAQHLRAATPRRAR